jgi:gentisate 1,2-dioxygenase
MRAGELISAQQAERRVLILENPGLPGQSAITPSLYAGLQLILPGEVAPCHRHSQSALRFVMEGDGAFTALDGEKAIMRPFDLVLTPGGQWHDHGNPTDTPMIWLDGLDIPTVRMFDAQFAEHFDGTAFPESAPRATRWPATATTCAPCVARPPIAAPRTNRCSITPTHNGALRSMLCPPARTLTRMSATRWNSNPADGGPIMPTIAAHVRLIPAGFETRARKTSDGTIFVVVEGCGTAIVGEKEIALSPRDIFVVPSWRELRLQASATLVLFAYSDKAAQEKLNLHREWNS